MEFLAAENLKTKRRFPPLLRWRVGTRLVVIAIVTVTVAVLIVLVIVLVLVLV